MWKWNWSPHYRFNPTRQRYESNTTNKGETEDNNPKINSLSEVKKLCKWYHVLQRFLQGVSVMWTVSSIGLLSGDDGWYKSETAPEGREREREPTYMIWEKWGVRLHYQLQNRGRKVATLLVITCASKHSVLFFSQRCGRCVFRSDNITGVMASTVLFVLLLCLQSRREVLWCEWLLWWMRLLLQGPS